MLKIYQIYLIKKFLLKFFYLSIIFFSLSYILNILDEISFFKNLNTHILYPYYLTLLNTPIILFEIFPFIFLLSTQFFFYELFINDELNLLKKNGLNNLKILKTLTVLTILMGLFSILIFYNFASKFQFHYNNIKNNLSNDNRYLAMVNDDGLWIKDEVKDEILIINSKIIKGGFLYETTINQFDLDFNLLRTIQVKKINIQNNEWILYKPILTTNSNDKKIINEITFETNFNEKKIKNYFSNMSTLNLFQLFGLKNEYEKLGYSSDGVTIHIFKLLTTPIMYILITILSAILMFNSKKKKTLVYYLIQGILLSVSIYYVNFIFNSLGNANKIPITVSIFFPLMILSAITMIGLIRINEK
jgi:lipopolysaccharide export system permease protein